VFRGAGACVCPCFWVTPDWPIKKYSSGFTAIVFFLGVACLFLYKIDAATGARMAEQLNERRKKYA
jgi:hypothetical protein